MNDETTKPKDNQGDSQEQTFISHLIELRDRIMRSLLVTDPVDGIIGDTHRYSIIFQKIRR